MKIVESIDPPSIERLRFLEGVYRIQWPMEFLDFLQFGNGGVPDDGTLPDSKRSVIERFLCVTDNPKEAEDGEYDIAVVQSQLDDRLSDDEDLIGAKLIPFAGLFAGDFLCFDYRVSAAAPKIVIWDHELSEELRPHTREIFTSFSEFLTYMKVERSN